MTKRIRRTVPVLALLAVAILLFRPVILDAIGSPFGAHNSAEVQLAGADGSPHCSLLADCETVSISNAGIDVASTGAVLVLAGVVIALARLRILAPGSWSALVPNPPPLLALS